MFSNERMSLNDCLGSGVRFYDMATDSLNRPMLIRWVVCNGTIVQIVEIYTV